MRKVKILIVEDEAIIARHLQMELTSDIFDVIDIVSNGEEAIQKVIENKPDIILMDINLNGKMNGIETMEILNSEIPVIFMTGYANQEFTERATKLNSIAYFNKPVDPDLIKPVIERHFKVR
jgi:DNA-binding NtrC family response regulator